ncbi:MAG: phosphopantetheine-binding protein [Candidatus Binatia bacterium]
MSAPGAREERTRDLLAFLRTIQKPGAPIEEVSEDVSLVEAGLIDSLAVLEIVSHLESTHGLDFAEAGIDPGDLTTIGGILDLIERLRPS